MGPSDLLGPSSSFVQLMIWLVAWRCTGVEASFAMKAARPDPVKMQW
jgi:aryl carrier-like protein